jgi:hypothetical protein
MLTDETSVETINHFIIGKPLNAKLFEHMINGKS